MSVRRRLARAIVVCLVASTGPACGGSAAHVEPRAPRECAGSGEIVVAAETSQELVRVDGIVVHVGTRESLSEVQRAYLARVERLIEVYDAAPRPPATYTHDAAAYLAWEPALSAYFAPFEEETGRLVTAHPRPEGESPEVRRFHVLLALVEARLRAQMLAANVGGRAGGSIHCPHDPPSHYRFAVTLVESIAERCLAALEDAPDVFFVTALRCGMLATEAHTQLSRAAPAAPDECLEHAPSSGE